VLTDRGARLDGCVELVGRPRWPADDPKARPDRIRPREAPSRPGCATAPGARPKSVPVIPGLLAEIHLGSRDASPARHNPHELNPREPISRNELFTGKSPGSAGDHVGSSAAPLPVRCAPSPSAAPLLLVQRRVKGRSGRGRGWARDHRCAWSRRPTHLFGLIGPARLAGDANGPADGGGHDGRQAREMAPWEDRSVPHPTAPLRKPRNHAETVEPTRSAGANDPPRAPKRPPRTHRNRPATEDRRRGLRGCAG